MAETQSTKAGAKNAQSTTRHQAKGGIQFDSDEVRTWVLPLMKRIYAGDYPTQAGRILGLSRSHVWYYVGKLQKAGLIYQEKHSNAAFYALTMDGSNLLKSCESRVFPGELHRLDKYQVAFTILCEGRYPDGQFGAVEMQNWTALLGLEQDVKVRHTSRSWIVHVPVIRGKNPAEVYGLAMNLSNRIAVSLGKKYGVVLAEGNLSAGKWRLRILSLNCLADTSV